MILALYGVNGRLIKKNVTRFRIKWDARSRSKLQFRAKQLLRQVWGHDVVFEEFPVYGTLLKLDFYNLTKQIAVEINGPQHDEYNEFFHEGSKLKWLASVARDFEKFEWAKRNGIKLVEYVESDLENASDFFKRLYGNL